MNHLVTDTDCIRFEYLFILNNLFFVANYMFWNGMLDSVRSYLLGLLIISDNWNVGKY